MNLEMAVNDLVLCVGIYAAIIAVCYFIDPSWGGRD